MQILARLNTFGAEHGSTIIRMPPRFNDETNLQRPMGKFHLLEWSTVYLLRRPDYYHMVDTIIDILCMTSQRK